ncbi:virion structural protein [Aeromonas phage D3]|uniref:Virion structural protein n=1 Tax=Aeromonas phage D3 TaxID=2593327 RepID=A0A514TVQ9_9CAUD|nr:virion structural protein [Aeromonas phage D3]QDJ97116.1 hypothetical protein D3_0118 [Aeromonas phage D3]
MNRPDYQLLKLDLSGESVFNRFDQEYGEKPDGEYNNLVIPLQAPFYISSVKMYHPDGSPMDYGVDYDFYGMLGKLTEYTAKEVGLFIRILKPEIKGYYIDYQAVGNFNKITDEILSMLRVIANDDRPVHWDNIDNKPLWFDPEIHLHDYTFHFFGFADLAAELARIQQLGDMFQNNVKITIDVFKERMESYIEQYQKVLYDLMAAHDKSKVDPHGVWKTDIGLGKVDNFKTATLQETLDVARSDLHITVGNAARAIELTKANNERLYPAGTLPLLRYGNDSYIPPKIDGSFEGMGGYNLRGCVARESNGSIVGLQHRNDGVIRGLYYIKCDDPYAKNPIWSFTGYRYMHPTAIADGANIDSVVNGSGRYVMMIGDAIKGIWYWCETNGTLDPSKHVLKRISGDFINYPYGMGQDLTILADSDYRDQWFVMATMSHGAVKALRPSYPTEGQSGSGTRTVEAIRIFTCINQANALNIATVDFTEQDGTTPKDKIWMPYTRTLKVVDGVTVVTGYDAEYTQPLRTLWNYRNIQAICRRTGTPGEYAFSIQNYLFMIQYGTEYASSKVPLWKGTMKLDKNNNTVKIVPGPGEKRYRLDPRNPAIAQQEEWELYKDWKTISYSFVTDGDGFVEFDETGNAIWVYPLASGVLPCGVRIMKPSNPKTPERVIGRRSEYDYGIDRVSAISEINPAGLTTGFSEPMSILGDTTKPQTGVVLARQLYVDGNSLKTEWIARPTPFMNPDWTGRNDNLFQMTVGGTQVAAYPLTPEVYKCDLGPYKFWSLHGFSIAPPGNAVRERWTRFGGADGVGNINGDFGVPADFLFPRISKTEIVGKKIVVTPVEVYNLRSMLETQIKPYLDSKGINTATIMTSWTLATVYNRLGEEAVLLMISDRNLGPGQQHVQATLFLGKLRGLGTPTIKDGYTYYENATLDFGNKHYRTGTVVSNSISTVIENRHPTAWRTGFCITDINTGTTPGSKDQTCVYLRSLHKYQVNGDTVPVSLVIEFDNAFTISRVGSKYVSSSPYSESVCCSPGNTMGYVSPADSGLARGACFVASGLSVTTNRYDCLISSDPGGATPKRLIVSNLLSSAYIIYFQEADNVLLGGRKYKIDATYVDIRDFDPNPANKTFYVYLTFNNGAPSYSIERSPLPEGSLIACVAVVTVGSDRIQTVVPYNRFLMDGVEISQKRRGSSILASTGTVFEVGWVGGIFKNTDYIPE